MFIDQLMTELVVTEANLFELLEKRLILKSQIEAVNVRDKEVKNAISDTGSTKPGAGSSSKEL